MGKTGATARRHLNRVSAFRYFAAQAPGLGSFVLDSVAELNAYFYKFAVFFATDVMGFEALFAPLPVFALGFFEQMRAKGFQGFLDPV